MRVYFTLQSDAKKISDNRSFKTRGDKGQPARKSIGNKIFLKRTRGKNGYKEDFKHLFA